MEQSVEACGDVEGLRKDPHLSAIRVTRHPGPKISDAVEPANDGRPGSP